MQVYILEYNFHDVYDVINDHGYTDTEISKLGIT